MEARRDPEDLADPEGLVVPEVPEGQVDPEVPRGRRRRGCCCCMRRRPSRRGEREGMNAYADLSMRDGAGKDDRWGIRTCRSHNHVRRTWHQIRSVERERPIHLRISLAEVEVPRLERRVTAITGWTP